MKYVMTWTPRLGGSGQDNEAAAKRGIEMFSKWTPGPGLKIEQFVGRVDGGGGFAVVDAQGPADLLEGTSKFAPYNDFQIYPVVDVEDWVRAAAEGVAFREAIS